MTLFDRLSDFCQRLLGKSESQADLDGAMPATNLRIRVGKKTSIGNYRDNNEDRLFVDENRWLYLVADGMGGQVAGEQASQLAVDLIPEELRTLESTTAEPETVRQAVRQAVVAANEAILAQGIADPSMQNMGTTVVLALLRGHRIFVAHIGDSRAYLFRKGLIDAVTTDHNLAQALYEAKTITKEELKTHRFKHVLWKYLGSKEAGDGPDIKEFEVRVGDRVLLATDGLTGVVEDELLLEEVYKLDDPQKTAERLVELALEQGSKDNITCVVLYIEEAT